MKVLLSAYACEPHRGSEPGVGWAWALGLPNEDTEVYVLTRANNKEIIEKELALLSPTHRPHFLYYDLPLWVLALKKKGLIPAKLYYLLWQFFVPSFLKKQAIPYDLLHHITFCSFRFPGTWWKKTLPKVILGPLGGISLTNPFYKKSYGRLWNKEKRRSFWVRHWNKNPWTKRCFQKAHTLLLATEETKETLAPHLPAHLEVSVHLETAIPHALETLLPETLPSHKENFVWAGGLEPWKGWKIALEAFALAFGSRSESSPKPKLIFIGKGSQQKEFLATIDKLQLNDLIEVRGHCSQKELWETMKRAKGLLFTSVRDTSGNVVLEAMALGCPILCLNHQGVKDMTDESCALRIEPQPWDKTVQAFAQNLQKLEDSPELVTQLSQGAYNRAHEQFLWSQKIEAIRALYKKILTPASNKDSKTAKNSKN